VQLALKITSLNHHQPVFLWLDKNEKKLGIIIRRKCAHTSARFKKKWKQHGHVPSGK
jgi:hypothetical protein